MPKKKGSKDSAAAAAGPACTCDHPYQCDCGNRPPRPSRGHKWDATTQTWGGKGHKQKGGPQAATVAVDKVVTTTVGQTVLLPHQRLPSALLAEVCQRGKRARPFYKELKTTSSTTFQYRLILQADKADDLHFVPAEAVPNAEQAKEEAALLALLHLTPALPHERKLPEPYRTTWLQALKAQKEAQKQQQSNSNNKKKGPDNNNNNNNNTKQQSTASAPNAGNNAAAQASTGLRSAVAVNRTAKLAERQQKVAARNARLARYEAIRLANQPHPVFMSAKLRRAIESILRHDATVKEEEDDEENDDAYYLDSMETDVKEYVEKRLHDEGFTRKQARQAFQQGSCSSLDNFEQAHEQALQWLLVHVDEEDLPPSFDPRGRTLDVIAGTSSSSNSKNDTTAPTVDPQILRFSQTHGLSTADASILCEGNNDSDTTRGRALWEMACHLAAVSRVPAAAHDPVDESMLDDELEALGAIFAEDCHMSRQEKSHIVTVQIPLDGMFHLVMTLDSTSYPQTWPQRILVQSVDNKTTWTQGLAVLAETAKFLSTDAVMGEPMLFAIHGHVMEVLQTLEELPVVTLAKTPAVPNESASAARKANAPAPSAPSPSQSVQLPRKRPRERSPFWSVPPNKTPPAVPFPAGALKRARASLPAAKARDDFLKALRRSEQGSHVVLCTGETGCGKSTQLPQVSQSCNWIPCIVCGMLLTV